MATIGNLWINVKSNTKGLSKGLGKAKGMLGKFGKFAASPAGIAVAGFAALTAGILLTVKALSGAVKEFMKFEAGMAEVKSVMLGLDSSAMEALEDTAKRLGATTAFTAEEAAQGMAMLARAGFTAAENITALPSVLDLAAASGMELGETANIMAMGMSGFGLAAEEAGHFADVLAVGANSANTTVAEMGEAFQHVAPIAKQLGFSVEETSAMIAQLQDSGIKGGKAGTALRVVFAELGAEIEKNGTGALKTYLKEGHNFTENLEKFGKLGVNAVGILQGMTDETASLTTNMTEATGVVNEMAEARLDTLAGDMTFFESAVSGLQTEIGEKLAPTLRVVVQVATDFIGGLQAAFSSLFEGVEGSIVSTESMMNVFKILGSIIFQIIGHAIMMYNKIAFGWNLLKTVGAGVLTVISGLVQALVEVVSWGMNAIGLMSDDTYDQTVGFMRDLTTDLADMTAEAGSDMGTNFVQMLGGGMADANNMFETFSDSMDGVGKAGGESLTEGMAEAIEQGAPVVTAALEKLTDAQTELVLSGTKLTDNLQEQITFYGMSAAEILIAKAEEIGLTSATIEGTLALEQQLQGLKDKVTAEEAAIKKSEELLDASLKVIESLRTPTEVYDEEVANLQNMMDKKLLTLEQFNNAVAKLKKGTEEDIEVNIITKGVVEGLQSAMGSIKVAGEVSKPEQLAQKAVDIQTKIEDVMNAVKENTKLVEKETADVAKNTATMEKKLSETITTDVKGLSGMMDKVQGEIKTLSSGDTMAETEKLLQDSNSINKDGFSAIVSELKNLSGTTTGALT